jgi:hypothetical protein
MNTAGHYLTEHNKVRLEEWRKFAPPLFDAYLLKEMFHQIWAARIACQEARKEYEQ